MIPEVNFKTAILLTQADDGYQQYAIIPDDDTRGFVIGELSEVEKVYQALSKLIQTKQADEEISEYDERLGRAWLSVSEAALQFGPSTETIRRAAREGKIKYAKLQGKSWRFPQSAFLYWKNRVYSPAMARSND